mmetsp:Transcript_18081/g.36530  ORF Transcript_18081/g.36530 Transcript_18081/m.36530 type:complete len:221 (-) Transcript_18081:1384-2046(-)
MIKIRRHSIIVVLLQRQIKVLPGLQIDNCLRQFFRRKLGCRNRPIPNPITKKDKGRNGIHTQLPSQSLPRAPRRIRLGKHQIRPMLPCNLGKYRINSLASPTRPHGHEHNTRFSLRSNMLRQTLHPDDLFHIWILSIFCRLLVQFGFFRGIERSFRTCIGSSLLHLQLLRSKQGIQIFFLLGYESVSHSRTGRIARPRGLLPKIFHCPSSCKYGFVAILE